MCRTLWKSGNESQIKLSVARSAHDIGVANITFYKWSYRNFLYTFSWGDFFYCSNKIHAHRKSLLHSEVKYRIKASILHCEEKRFCFYSWTAQLSSQSVCQLHTQLSFCYLSTANRPTFHKIESLGFCKWTFKPVLLLVFMSSEYFGYPFTTCWVI